MKPDKGNNNGNNNKRNIMGLVSIIFWALLFTMMIKSCTSSYANMGTVEVPYTTFKEWLAEDKIDTVNVENGKYTFTLRDGVEVELPREETSGGSGSLMNSLIPVPAQTEEEKQYITVPLAGVDDPELLAMLEEHADHAYTARLCLMVKDHNISPLGIFPKLISEPGTNDPVSCHDGILHGAGRNLTVGNDEPV